jgi:hypothetical protein
MPSKQTKSELLQQALIEVMSDQMAKLEMLKDTGENLEEAINVLFPMYIAISESKEKTGYRLGVIAAPFSMIPPQDHLGLLMQADEEIQNDVRKTGSSFIGWCSVVAAGQFDRREVDIDSLSEQDINMSNMALVASICTPEGDELAFASSLDRSNFGFIGKEQTTQSENISALVIWSLATKNWLNIGDLMKGMASGGAECH